MNRLASETSPYLRQHRDNPVDWYAWGADAFAAASERGVPILLSVGYSACHWCHVMAHESFEDADVAVAMNSAFVNVKVDREERPDVDAVYMDAVQAMTGRGGWPMTVFLTPSGEPFYGGTYYPRPTFLRLLAAIEEAWRDRRDDLAANIHALRQALDHSAQLTAAAALPDKSVVGSTVDAIVATWDSDWGGFGAAPKFPSTMSLDLVLTEAVHGGGDEDGAALLRSVVASSLDGMAAGGIYDHVGGGFARYSVDDRWLVPHFEKMLYDQALMVRLFSHAASALDVARWRQVVAETVGYVLRDLRLADGGFASAEDADSPGPDGHQHEGRFTTWTPEEIAAVVGEAAPSVCAYYDITAAGNFEGRSIPNRIGGWPADWERPADIESARVELLAAREQRPRPGLDDKVLTEWNALMIGALAEAGSLLGEASWVEAASAAALFLLDELRDEHGRWQRAWHRDGDPKARHSALAADHAALVEAFVRLAEATGSATWIGEAITTADRMLDRFWDDEHGGLFTTAADGERLIVRQKDLYDNATPSANSTAAAALQRLAALTGHGRYAERADDILRLLAPLVPRGPGAFGNLVGALVLRTRGITEVVVAGDRPDLRAVVAEHWRPDVVLAWGERYESPLWEGRRDGFAYVCRQYTCRTPAATADELRTQLTAS